MLIFLGILISIGISIIFLLSREKAQKDMLKSIDQMHESSLKLSESLSELEKCYKQITKNMEDIENIYKQTDIEDKC